MRVLEVLSRFIEANKSSGMLNQLLQIDGRFARAYHLCGLLFHAMGDHRELEDKVNALTMKLDLDFKTGLMQACRYRHWEVVQRLLFFRCNEHEDRHHGEFKNFHFLLMDKR